MTALLNLSQTGQSHTIISKWATPEYESQLLLEAHPPFNGKRPQPLLWASLWAKLVKITVSTILNCLQYCIILWYVIYHCGHGGVKRWLVAHGDYSDTSNYQTKIHVIFQDIFIIVRSIWKQLCIYFSIPLRIPNGVLWNAKFRWNPVWETMLYSAFPQVLFLASVIYFFWSL